jgi:hypothetical protein
MFSHTQTFYNKSIRNIVIAFGSLFESIYIIRNDENGVEDKKIRVPFEYGNKEKFIWSLTKETTGRIQITLPRMGFELTNIVYDPTRKSNRLNLKTSYVNGVYKKVFSEVPYNIGFSVYVFTRHMDDMLQIVEQILPYFAPEFNITIKMNDVHQEVDVPIILNGVSINEDFEGNLETRRSLIGVLDFTVKMNVYPEICGSTGGIIERSDVNFYEKSCIGPGNYVGDIGYTGDSVTGSITGVTGDWSP